MEVTTLIERIYGIELLIIAVSLITASRMWKKIVKLWLHQPEQFNWLALIMLPLGLLTIMLHNVWSGLGILVTLLGWIVTIKSTLLLCFPYAIHKMFNTALLKKKVFMIEAACYLVVSSLILYGSYMPPTA